MSLVKGLETRVEEILRSNTLAKAKRLFGSQAGMKMIAFISFLESAFPFPILTDPFLVAAVLANRVNTVRLIIITTVFSVVGGVFAYFTALLFLDILLQWVNPVLVEHFESIIVSDESSTAMLTLIGAFTPVPYTLVAWALVVVKGSLGIFIVVSLFGRGLRYAIVGYCAHRFGPLAINYARRYIGITSVLLLVFVTIFVLYKM